MAFMKLRVSICMASSDSVVCLAGGKELQQSFRRLLTGSHTQMEDINNMHFY